MRFVWFFFMIYTMGSFSRVFEEIKPLWGKFTAQATYYVIMTIIAFTVYQKFGIVP